MFKTNNMKFTPSYHRTAEKILSQETKLPNRIARFEQGRLLTGTASLHRTEVSRRWRLFWRLKAARNINSMYIKDSK